MSPGESKKTRNVIAEEGTEEDNGDFLFSFSAFHLHFSHVVVSLFFVIIIRVASLARQGTQASVSRMHVYGKTAALFFILF